MEALSRSKFDDALQSFTKAVALDPEFGLRLCRDGHCVPATWIGSRMPRSTCKQAIEPSRQHDGARTLSDARLLLLRHQRLSACVKEYGDLIARFAADAAARNNLALCLTHLRDCRRAIDEMRQVVKILPNRALYRVNLALYANYSGDFQTGEQEVRAMRTRSWSCWRWPLPRRRGPGRAGDRIQPDLWAASKKRARSYAASGLGDLAMYERPLRGCGRILGQGAADDLKAGKRRSRGQQVCGARRRASAAATERPAAEAAEQALANSQAVKIRFLAARVFVEAGATAERKRSAPASPPSSRPSRRRTPRSSRA